ncbi:hypothetical protein IW261DRAFT_1573931 [Armillaria novae-zelandiae]|uniref:Uncharacterized protein n=1 Tax=Armillaria novae-zelandiae TaxID=153914 RepID=A0AA39TVC5_9AGAR|nr:hypothetical protein IW261DRAFT_1573931 [Armillaria novae-zelandiae]
MTMPGSNIGLQTISCSCGCPTVELLFPSPEQQVELLNIIQEDKLAHSLDGKKRAEVVQRSGLCHDKAKADMLLIKYTWCKEDLVHAAYEWDLSAAGISDGGGSGDLYQATFYTQDHAPPPPTCCHKSNFLDDPDKEIVYFYSQWPKAFTDELIELLRRLTPPQKNWARDLDNEVIIVSPQLTVKQLVEDNNDIRSPSKMG